MPYVFTNTDVKTLELITSVFNIYTTAQMNLTLVDNEPAPRPRGLYIDDDERYAVDISIHRIRIVLSRNSTFFCKRSKI